MAEIEVLTGKLLSWIGSMLPKLLAAILILGIGWWLSNLVGRVVKRAMLRTKAEVGFVTFLCSTIKSSLKVIICITAVAQFMDVTSIIAALGAAGLTVGLALKDSMSNIASGVQIIFTRPFKAGDYITISTFEGTVDRIEIMYTVLKTFDNKEIVIPNSTVTISTITNFTAMDKRRLDLTYTIGYYDDIDLAKQILYDLTNENDLVLKDPEPLIAVGEHRESAVALVCKIWCNRDDYWTLYYRMQEQVKSEFQKAHINIPYQQIDVHMKKIM